MLVPEELTAQAARFGSRIAVRVDRGPTLTYREWDATASRVARGMAAAGIGRGDRVVLLLTNAEACDFAVAFAACHRAGAAAVPVNPRYAAHELDHILEDSGARLVIAGTEAPRVHGVPATSCAELATGDASPFSVELAPDDLSEIFYTSGTTGLPRGVASTHSNHARAHGMAPLDAGGVLLHSIPLATFTGVQGGVLTPLRLAVTALVLPRFDTARFAELIGTEHPLWLLMVPAHILLLLESGVLEAQDTSSVAIAMFGGAPTPPAAVLRLGELLPNAMLLNGYGLTEGGGSVCVLPPGEAVRRPGSVGKPMRGVEVRIVDDAGEPVPTGEVGEIALRVPEGERRYWNDAEASAQTWRGGWVHTGDLGRLDEDGFLYVVDRAKDIINRGGYNVASAEVEAAIHEQPDVAECAVVGVPHPILGQDVAAVVRMRDGAVPLTLDELRARLADRLADYKLPRVLVVTTEPLPRNAAGKLHKPRITEMTT
ncbi:MAG: class I adenylate-forming enzyme family protein [Acidimicrobiia bacterium]